jgi:hypothetical protein
MITMTNTTGNIASTYTPQMMISSDSDGIPSQYRVISGCLRISVGYEMGFYGKEQKASVERSPRQQTLRALEFGPRSGDDHGGWESIGRISRGGSLSVEHYSVHHHCSFADIRKLFQHHSHPCVQFPQIRRSHDSFAASQIVAPV